MQNNSRHKYFRGLRKLRNYLFPRTIKAQVTMGLIVMAVITTLLLSLIYFYKMNQFVYDNIKSYNQEIIKQNADKIEKLLDEVVIVQNQLIEHSIHSDMQAIWDYENPEQRIQEVKRMDDFIALLKRNFPFISEIYYIAEDQNVYSTHHNTDFSTLKEKLWITTLNDVRQGGMLIPTHFADYYDRNMQLKDKLVISYVKKFKYDPINNKSCILQIDVNYKDIEDIIQSMDIIKDTIIVIYDKDGLLIYPYQYDEQFQQGEDIILAKELRDTYLPINYQLLSVGWQIEAYVGLSEMVNKEREIRLFIGIILIFVIIISLFLSLTISESITKPLKQLIQKMQGASKGDFKPNKEPIFTKDIQILDASFNAMLDELHVFMKNYAESEKSKVKSELKALQSQINSHFLYNTLEVIRGIALMNKVQSIADISRDLAKIFRYSIKSADKIVTIKDEIDYVNSYIQIQKHRYKDRFEVIYEMDETLLLNKVICLVLQPLVENAFYHGIETKVDKGLIIIRCHEKDSNTLTISVYDNGIGMKMEQVDVMNRGFKHVNLQIKERIDGSMGMGLMNVNQRIKLTYGEIYGLSVTSQHLQWTEFTILLPKNV